MEYREANQIKSKMLESLWNRYSTSSSGGVFIQTKQRTQER